MTRDPALQPSNPDTTLSRTRRRWLLLVLCLAFSCVALDNTKLAVALPTLTREFGGHPLLKWLVEANLLVYASLLLLGGAIAERIGARRTLLAGLSLFAIASLCAAAAPSAILLLAARAAMGVGTALLTPATLATIKLAFPDHERPGAIAVWTASFGLGATGGPLLSGWVIERWGSGPIMISHLPLVLASWLGALYLVPRGLPRRTVPIDGVSSALGFAATFGVLFLVLEGPALSARSLLGAAIATALVMAALVVWQTRARHPLLDPTLFRSRRFAGALLVILLAYLAFSGGSFVIAQYLQLARGFSPLSAAIRALPLATAMLCGTLLAPAAMRRLGAKTALIASLGVAALGAASICVAGFCASDLLLTLAQIPFGLGSGSAFANATELVIGSAPQERAGTAAAINETAFEFGGVMGIALLSSLGDSSYGAAPLSRFGSAAPFVAAAGALLLALLVAASLGNDADADAPTRRSLGVT